METFSALLAICAGNSPVPGEFPTQRPVSRSFDVFFDLRPSKRLNKQWWGWWFEMPSCPLWRHCNASNYKWLLPWLWRRLWYILTMMLENQPFKCWSHIRDPTLVITVPEDDLAPYGARPLGHRQTKFWQIYECTQVFFDFVRLYVIQNLKKTLLKMDTEINRNICENKLLIIQWLNSFYESRTM